MTVKRKIPAADFVNPAGMTDSDIEINPPVLRTTSRHCGTGSPFPFMLQDKPKEDISYYI